MGRLEERSRKRAKRRNLKRAILLAVQTAALLGAFVAAPAVPSALHRLGLLPRKYHMGTIQRARDRLIHQGLLRSEKGRLHLTSKGIIAFTIENSTAHIGKQKRRWDGRWRLLIFDVPESRRSVREKIRRTLRAIGFKQLQQSVWVYPFDCEDFVVLLKAENRIGRDVLYLIVDELENDKWLREEFGLGSR